jgi:transposase
VIVIGIDPHKQTHTAVAVESGSGELLSERTVKARTKGYGQLLLWARGLDHERVFALEDCRHVSGSLERFLLARGERVVRVPPKLMGRARRSGRGYGKSDAIDALAVARAALREPKLPVAFLAGAEREIKLLLDHREDLVQERSRIQQRLRWHLHDLDAAFHIPAGALDRYCWLERTDALLTRRGQSVQVTICRELVLRCRELTRRANELERELERLISEQAPPLLELRGCAALTAAKLLAEAANVGRFSDDAGFAMYGGVGPLDASSGQQRRHRLNPFGNRQLNCALHRIAVTQGRSHEPARSYLARKQAEGKSRKEALRCLKRHLARTVYAILKQLKEADIDTVERLAITPALT